MADTNGRKPGGEDEEEDGIADLDNEDYDTMTLLEQMETLEEEMEELGVTTLEELRQRIRELHEKLGG